MYDRKKGMVTSYLTKISLKNDYRKEICWWSRHDLKLGSLKDYLGSLEEVNHESYLLDLLK